MDVALRQRLDEERASLLDKLELLEKQKNEELQDLKTSLIAEQQVGDAGDFLPSAARLLDVPAVPLASKLLVLFKPVTSHIPPKSLFISTSDMLKVCLLDFNGPFAGASEFLPRFSLLMRDMRHGS